MANQTSTDGFNLSSILNDDELQLMDMAMNEGQYYSHFSISYCTTKVIIFFTYFPCHEYEYMCTNRNISVPFRTYNIYVVCSQL